MFVHNPPKLVRTLTLAALLTLAACSGPEAASTTDPTVATTAAPVPSEVSFVLPEREGARRQTTGSVPHIQLDAELVPAVDTELRRRAYLLPGVEDRESVLSLPGARGLWLSDEIELVRPDVIAAGREFAHIHPDGSLHVWLPVDRAVEVDQTKWGELHPWADRDGFWDGVVMIYTPETLAELEISIRLVVEAYNFVTGANLDPEAFK
jgi:phospholipase/carboxylesterase